MINLSGNHAHHGQHDDQNSDPFSDEDRIERAPPWLLSFGDVTALMLTFFVMLFSMSEINSEEWENVINIVSTSIDPTDPQIAVPNSEQSITTIDILPSLPKDYLYRLLNEKLQTDPDLQDMMIQNRSDSVILSLPTLDFFQGPELALSPEAEKVMFSLTSALSQFGNQIKIVGHDEPGRVDQTRYANHWDVSLMRAMRVGSFLKDAGYPSDFIISGVGDSHFKHLSSDLSESDRLRLAHRVDFIILSEAGGQ